MVNTEGFLYYRGRVALYDMLHLLGAGSGDEVLLQAFTCVAVPEAILAVDASPVWVDLATNSVTLDPDDLARKITPRTKAVIVQHTFGIPAKMQAIVSIAREHRLPIIEDCCHGSESTYKDCELGTFGAGAFWSYEWGKPTIAGVGGESRYNDMSLQRRAQEQFQERFGPPPLRKSAVIAAQFLMHSLLYRPRTYWAVRKIFRALGRAKVAETNYHAIGTGTDRAVDFGWRMSGFSRRRLPSARAHAKAFLERRMQQQDYYEARLDQTNVSIPTVPECCRPIYSRFPVFVQRKEALLKVACSANIELADWYATPVHPLHGEELRRVNYVPGSCPKAENAARTLVSLPLGPKVSAMFQRKLVDLINVHSLS